MEEGHDELVTEVIKRMEENDLYIKLEKCKQKVRKVEFLEVVIGPEGIKMVKVKVKGMLKQPIPKCVKDIQKFLGLANYYCRFIQDFVFIARPLHNTVVATTYYKGQMISLMSKPQKKYDVGIHKRTRQGASS